MSGEAMLKRLFGAALQRVVLPVGGAVGRAGITPNMVTVAGFLVTIAAAGAIAQGRFLLGGLVLIAGSVSDMLDGAVARATGKISKGGAFLDSVLDRLSDAAVFVGLIWWYSNGSEAGLPSTAAAGVHHLGVQLALAGLILSLMVSYLRARAEGLGFTCNVGIAERPERIFILCTGLILNQMIPALVVLVAATAVTVVWRFVHVWRQARTA
ncbi:MAG: CDP-alcohol phosphatidyltransferase family protein [Actinomycetota bacterium]